MSLTWRPSAAGKLFTSTMDWALTMVGDRFVMQLGGKKLVGPVLSLEGLSAKPRIFWSTVSVPNLKHTRSTVTLITISGF